MLQSRNLMSKVLPLAIVMVLAAVLLVLLPVQAEQAEGTETTHMEPREAEVVDLELLLEAAPMSGPGGSNPCAPGEYFCCLDDWQGPEGYGSCGPGTRDALCTSAPNGVDVCNSSKATTDFFCVTEPVFCFQ